MNGKKKSSDITLGLGVVKAIKLGIKKFVLSIDSSLAVEKYIIKHGGQVWRSKVGEANVIQMMIKNLYQVLAPHSKQHLIFVPSVIAGQQEQILQVDIGINKTNC